MKPSGSWVYYEVGIVSNIDDKLLGISRRHHCPVIWVNRHGTKPEGARKAPDATVKNFREAVAKLGAK